MFDMTSRALLRVRMEPRRCLRAEIGPYMAGYAFYGFDAFVRRVAAFAIGLEGSMCWRQGSGIDQRRPALDRATSRRMRHERDNDDKQGERHGKNRVKEPHALHSQRNPK